MLSLTGQWLMGEDAPPRGLSLYRYDEAGDLTLAQDKNAELMGDVYAGLMVPVLRQYSELDPDSNPGPATA